MTHDPVPSILPRRNTFNWPLLALSCLLSVLLIGVVTNNIRRVQRSDTGDFRHFYEAARAMRLGTDPYTSGTGGYIYPPLLAFLYVPLGMLEQSQAEYVALAVNVGILALAVGLLSAEYAKRFDCPTGWQVLCGIAVIGTLLNFDKVKGELQMWQTNGIVLLCFALALRWIDRLPWLAGLALAVAFNIKYQSLIAVPYLLMRRRWMEVFSFIAFSVLLLWLPSVLVGWEEDQRYLSVAFAGLFRLVGGDAGKTQSANIEKITDPLSISVTSGFLRLADAWDRHWLAWPLVLLTAGLVTGLVAREYRRCRVPFLFWPARQMQTGQPYQAIIGAEWAAIVSAALIFSPQTNTRHLVMALIVAIAGTALLYSRCTVVSRVLVAVGLAVLCLGFILPPGSRFADVHHWTLLWGMVGGRCWALLIAVIALACVGVAHGKALANSSST